MPIPLGILAVAGAGAGAAGAFDLLETTVLGSATSSITFSSLDSYSAYKHLQIRVVARDTNTGGSYQFFGLRLNGDTGSNYGWHGLDANGSSVSSLFATDTSTNIGYYYDGAADSSIFAPAVIDILDFSSSNKNTTLRALSGVQGGTTNRLGFYSGLWRNTAAVTSLTIFSRSTSFAIGSRFSLYGIK